MADLAKLSQSVMPLYHGTAANFNKFKLFEDPSLRHRYPEMLRSKFAAFDPMKRNSSDILAGAGGLSLAGLLGMSMYDGGSGQ